jgi:branched-chain amino acid transport system ATP-binding protein
MSELAPLLELKKVDTNYGPVQVHFSLNFKVQPGQIVSLLGGNASGKSTAMKVILGLLRPRAGGVEFKSKEITDWPTRRRIAEGMASVPEARRLFADMTVRENILMGAFLRADSAAVEQDLERWLERLPRVAQRLHQRAGHLSGGEQQMVAIARALMGRPRLVCMDEPTMGLSPLYVDRVLDLMTEINKEGVSIFMVEQNASLALEIAHYAYVLQQGRIVLSGAAATLRNDSQIQDAYLGSRRDGGSA